MVVPTATVMAEIALGPGKRLTTQVDRGAGNLPGVGSDPVYTPRMEPKPGELVVLAEVPSGFLDDLPLEDQQAIVDVVGKPIVLRGYDDDGRAELEFEVATETATLFS